MFRAGTSRSESLTGKYLVGRTAEPTRATYRERFTQNPENAAFLKEIEAQFE